MKENVYFCLNETNYDFSMDIAEEVGIFVPTSRQSGCTLIINGIPNLEQFLQNLDDCLTDIDCYEGSIDDNIDDLWMSIDEPDINEEERREIKEILENNIKLGNTSVKYWRPADIVKLYGLATKKEYKTMFFYGSSQGECAWFMYLAELYSQRDLDYYALEFCNQLTPALFVQTSEICSKEEIEDNGLDIFLHGDNEEAYCQEIADITGVNVNNVIMLKS